MLWLKGKIISLSIKTKQSHVLFTGDTHTRKGNREVGRKMKKKDRPYNASSNKAGELYLLQTLCLKGITRD